MYLRNVAYFVILIKAFVEKTLFNYSGIIPKLKYRIGTGIEKCQTRTSSS